MECNLSEQPNSSVAKATEKQQKSQGFVCKWSYFDKLNDRRARCKICSKFIMGHANINYHLKIQHPDEYDIYISHRRTRKYRKVDSPTTSLSDEDEKTSVLRSGAMQSLPTSKASKLLSPRSACRPCYVHIGSLKATLMENANALQWLLASRSEDDVDGPRQFSLPISSLLQSERTVSTSSGTSVRLCFEPIQRKDGASNCQTKTKTATASAPACDNAQPCTSDNSAPKPSVSTSRTATAANKRKILGCAAFSPAGSSVPKRGRPRKLERHLGIKSRITDNGIPSYAKELGCDPHTSEKIRLYDKRFEQLFGYRQNSASSRNDSEIGDWAFANPDAQNPIVMRENKLFSILQNASSSQEISRDNAVRALIWCCKTPLPGYGNQNNIQYLFELAD